MEWIPRFDATAAPLPGSPVFAFGAGRVLVRGDGSPPRLAELPPDLRALAEPIDVGLLDGEECFALAVEPREGMVGLRELLAALEPPLAAAAARAAQTVEWELAHRFCGRCGAPTERSATEIARVCTRCDAASYPRISPAVIMLVERDGAMLLARRPGGAFFSTLAGFVEPAETLEQAVVREVREEVGLEVDGVRYFGSQPWPFPSQLMVGFVARAAAGELRVDASELAEARWFPAGGELPPVPPPYTIARSLIDDFAGRHVG